jgi:hypothetical protein
MIPKYLTYLIRSSHTFTMLRLFFFILIILQSVELIGRVISSSQDLYINTGQHKQRINIPIPNIHAFFGFEPTIPVSERGKTVHALDRSATVTGPTYLLT